MQTHMYDLAARQQGPAIVLGSRDAATLRGVVARADGSPAERLEAALRGAIIVPQAHLPGDIVSLGSTVLVECTPGGAREVVVVEPWLANGGRGFVSVLDALGAALLGAAEGETVQFQAPDGRLVSARIVAVDPGGRAA